MLEPQYLAFHFELNGDKLEITYDVNCAEENIIEAMKLLIRELNIQPFELYPINPN